MKKNFLKKMLSLTLTIISIVTFATMSSIQNLATSSSTWYSQYDNTVGTTWSMTDLNKLYFPNIGTCSYCGTVHKCANTPLYASTSFVGTSTQLAQPHLRMFGCNMASAAMVLKNLGATTSSTRYDLRTKTSYNLAADPYTVTMANIGWLSTTYNSNNTHYEITGYTAVNTPCYVSYWYNIANSFGKTAYNVDFSTLSTDSKAYNLDYYIKQNPEGILVRINGSHTLVFTASNYTSGSNYSSSLNNNVLAPAVEITQENQYLYEDEGISNIYSVPKVSNIGINSTYDSMFYCCDPATGQASKGDNVLFTSSYSYLTYGGIENINWIRFFN